MAGATVQLDLNFARVKRDAAIDAAAAHAAASWVRLATLCLLYVATTHERLTSEGVLDQMARTASEIRTHERRALANVVLEGKRRGWIAATGEWRTYRNPSRNAAPSRVWRSLIFGRKERG
ncbi:MAG: hypothetical protein ABFD84_15615 [Candidatus Polarisedimenticolia bacterium]|nr:hypothetical protein [bacterium]